MRYASSQPMTVWPSSRLIALIGVAFSLVLHQYYASGLADRPLSFRYYLSTLPTAVTAMRGIANDSTSAVEISEYFREAGPHLTVAQLRASLTCPVSQPEQRIVFLKGDDLGLPQFVRAAFALFGMTLRAPHELFFLVLAASLLLFVAAHAREPAALGLGLFFVLAVYAVTFVLGLSTQLWTAIDVRFIGALAILPCLHLALVAASGRWSWPQQLSCLPQAVLIAVVYQVRSSSAWVLVALGAVAAVAAARQRRTITGVVTGVFPLIVACGAVGAVAEYQHLRIHTWFRTEIPANHLLWHSIHTGLAANPELSHRYQLAFADVPAHQAVRRYLAAHDPARVRTVFGTDAPAGPIPMFPPGLPDYNTINWREYERAARDTVMQMARDEPAAMIATFMFYKPVMLMRTLAWATGWADVGLETIAMDPVWVSSPSQRAARGEYLRWFRPAALGLFVFGLVCLYGSVSDPTARMAAIPDWSVALMIFVASSIPVLLVWPAFQWLGDVMITAGLLTYTALAKALGAVIRIVHQTASARSPDGSQYA